MPSSSKRSHGGDRGSGDQRAKRKRAWQPQIQGPGIFVSCVRGKERKAAHELIEVLEELADRMYAGVELEQRKAKRRIQDDEDDMDALRNGKTATPPPPSANPKEKDKLVVDTKDDIEDQISAELADLKNGKEKSTGSHESRPQARFTCVMTDIECFFFISVARPLDPVKLTYAHLDNVKETGQARSRFIHRMSPVYDIVYADTAHIIDEADRVIAEYLPSRASVTSSAITFKVDIKLRLHNQLAKMDLVHALAKRMPDTARAQLSEPDIVINVEVFRMTCGLSLLPNFEAYRKLNPIMLAEQWHASSKEDEIDGADTARSRVKQ